MCLPSKVNGFSNFIALEATLYYVGTGYCEVWPIGPASATGTGYLCLNVILAGARSMLSSILKFYSS